MLYDPAKGLNEYFILEYRRPGSSYDVGRGTDGGGGFLPAGLAVWHVIEDQGLRQRIGLPQTADNWYRQGIRLIRADGGTPLPVNDQQALFAKKNTRLSLTWSDGSAVPFGITLLDDTSGSTTFSQPDSVASDFRLQITRAVSVVVY